MVNPVWASTAVGALSGTAILDRLGIPYDVTPGVPAFAASAALLRCELTVPEVAQSLVLTRTPAAPPPCRRNESLAAFARTGATLAIHLSIHVLDATRAELTPFYGADCPVAIVFRASWPDEGSVRGTLADIERALRRNPHRAHSLGPRRPGARRGKFPRERALRARTICSRFPPARRRR